MPIGTIILLGAFAGLTIFLGLPLAFLRNLSQRLRVFLNMLATGVLLFLLYDVISKASEPISDALTGFHNTHKGGITLALDIALLAVGIGLGSVGLVYFNRLVMHLRSREKRSSGGEQPQNPLPPPDAQAHSTSSVQTIARPAVATQTVPGQVSPHTLALLIAIGIGLHNFSEGLAIGQSAVTGAIQLAIVLIIGFGLHNMTEGFGIAGPLTGERVSWKFIALLGLIGGGPTFVGTIVGIIFNSTQVFILFLALAAGAIVYVIAELLGSAKRFKAPEIVMWGLVIGFLLGYATDLIVTFAGA